MAGAELDVPSSLSMQVTFPCRVASWFIPNSHISFRYFWLLALRGVSFLLVLAVQQDLQFAAVCLHAAGAGEVHADGPEEVKIWSRPQFQRWEL